MPKFVPYEKLSKKERRKIDAARRTGWGELNPVTRKPENSRAYSRKKAQAWKKDPSLRYFYASVGFRRKSSRVPQAPPGAVMLTPMVTVPEVQEIFSMAGFCQLTQPSTVKGCS